MYRMRWRLNLLSLGDETAFSLGLAPTRERALLLVAAVAATSAVISVAGMGVEIPLRQTVWNRGVPDDFHVCLQADLLARGADLEGIFSAGEDPDMAG